MNLQDIASRLDTVSNISIVDIDTRTAARNAAFLIRTLDLALPPGVYAAPGALASIISAVASIRKG